MFHNPHLDFVPFSFDANGVHPLILVTQLQQASSLSEKRQPRSNEIGFFRP